MAKRALYLTNIAGGISIYLKVKALAFIAFLICFKVKLKQNYVPRIVKPLLATPTNIDF